MENRPFLIVGGVFTAFVLAMLLAYWLSGNSRRTPIKQSTSSKVLHARRGTERENARALLRDKPTTSSPQGGTRDPEDMEIWGRLSPSDAAGASAEPYAEPPEVRPVELREPDAIDAQSATTPDGAAVFPEPTELAGDTGDADPVDLAQVDEIAEASILAAENEREILEARFNQAKQYLEQGRADDVLDIVNSMPPRDGPLTSAGLELEMLGALAHQRLGSTDAAIAAFRSVMNEVEAADKTDPEIVGVYRQAALHLSRQLRQAGRTEEAEQVTLKLKTPQGIERR